MALTTDDLNKIEQLLKASLADYATRDELKVEFAKFASKDDLKHLRSNMNNGFETVARTLRGEMRDGFESVLETMNEHMQEDDRRFMSDRKRIARLEKIVL